MSFENVLKVCLIASAILIETWTVLPRPLMADESMVLEEVLVTARKREESLHDITAAVSVVDGDRMRNNVINDVRDLQALVPSLNIGEVVGLMKITMRGLGNSTNTRSEDPDVVLHVDGAVVSRMEAQSMAFFDLDRIEVLRGPQGTLYGRNSTGGTINLVTTKPSEEFTGYVNVMAGNYNFVKTEAAVGGPLSDRVLGRVALQSISRGGYGKNITTGNDLDDEHRWAARAHLDFLLSDNVDFLLTGEYANEDDAGGFFTYLGPLYPGVVTPAGEGGFSDPKSRDGASNFDPRLERTTYSITGTLNWQLNDTFTLKDIVNFRNLDFFLAQDLDTSSVPNNTAVSIPLNDDQYSEELQFIYNGDRLNGLAGLFYFKETFDGKTNIGLTPTEGIFYTLVGKSETEAWAPFFNVTYRLTDQFSLRAGGRYNKEKRTITNDAYFNGNRITTDHDISDDSRKLKKYTGEYGIDFNVSDSSLLYYTYSQGFRSGAALIFQSNSPIIDPTTVDSHEVGYKLQSEDGTFSANLALYKAKVKNLQRTQASLDANGLLVTRVNNVNSLDTKGVEIDLSWVPVERFRLSAALAYVDAEFKDFVTDDPLMFGSNPIQVAGNTPRLTPDWKGNLHAELDFPLPSAAKLTASADLSYTGDQFFDEFNRAPFDESSYTLVDASLTWRPASENWSVAAWGKNLTDEKRLADTSFSAFGGVTSKHFINPLTWGVTVSYQF